MAKKKRYHESRKDDGREMMARREYDEMGHGSSLADDKRGYSYNGGRDMRGYDGGREMARRMDNSDPVPNTVRALLDREAYAGKKESRFMMARDGAMLREDMSAPALMPRQVIDEYWPKAPNGHMGYVDDLFYGVQRQMGKDNEDFGRIMDPKKY